MNLKKADVPNVRWIEYTRWSENFRWNDFFKEEDSDGRNGVVDVNKAGKMGLAW